MHRFHRFHFVLTASKIFTNTSYVLFSDLFAYRQLAPPGNYDVALYGPWPQAGVWVTKMRCPPSWKSTRDATKFHTVTTMWGHEIDTAINPLHMPVGLEQLLDWHCNCSAGFRTSGSCCHRDAYLKLVSATSCINDAKVPEAVVVDPAW